MFELKACKVCFSTNTKLYSMDVFSFRRDYNTVSGLKTSKKDKHPDYLCSECFFYVRNFMKFRDKCQKAHFALEELIRQNKKIDLQNLISFDRKIIGNMPTLSYLDKSKTYYEEAKFQWIKNNRTSITEKLNIEIIHCSTIEDTFVIPNTNETKVKEESMIDGHVSEEIMLDNEKMLNDLVAKNINSDYFDDEVISDNDHFDDDTEAKVNTEDADGSQLDEEYADMVPITLAEAKAVVEVYKMFSSGKAQCNVCQKSYIKQNRLESHMRMHNKEQSGNYHCELCQYYYKTEYLLKTHIADKHMYKYLCRKCPEVSFDRPSAKQHFVWVHLQKGEKKNSTWYDTRPTWLSNKGGKRTKGKSKKAEVVSLRPVRKIIKLPEDFLKYTPISQTEQYQMVLDRKTSRNYLEAKFRCELCYKGFRETATYNKHMKKHDPAISGPLQCDMCKLQFCSTRNVYKHMIITHLFKYSCQWCSFVCCNRGQAHMHYRFHKNVTYQCPHCSREFKKASTRLTHIRIKHPSMNICKICGHSFVSVTGLYCHKKIAHSKEEIKASEDTPVDKQDSLYCAQCDIHFQNYAAFKTHLGSSSKHASTNLSINPTGATLKRRTRYGRAGRPPRSGAAADDIVNNGLPTATHCEICNKFLINDVQARKHYEAEHPGTEYLKRYMCDVCGHTTKQYANLMVHMRTHTNEKPYKCPHCDRSFSMPSNRDRHIVVHTGEKRYQCEHCNRRFTQSSAVKLHIQTVHLKIPYPPWDKKNRKRRKELEGTSAPVSAVTPAVCIQPPPKIIIESQDYLNAYITYNDDV